ncbi:MAG: hypothetical protein ACK4NB_05225, partial [Fimbriimonadales bacterium]
MRLFRREKGKRIKLRSTDIPVRAQLRIVGVPPTRSAWAGMSKPRVPIQEPTGKFTLPAPPAKPPRRRIRKSGIARKL